MKVEIHHVDMQALAAKEMIPILMSDDDVLALIAAGHYRKVATVNVHDLSDAFRKTQNGVDVDCWATDHPTGIVDGVPVLINGHDFRKALRSSMVGDVFSADGMVHMVDNFGFRKLGPHRSVFSE